MKSTNNSEMPMTLWKELLISPGNTLINQSIIKILRPAEAIAGLILVLSLVFILTSFYPIKVSAETVEKTESQIKLILETEFEKAQQLEQQLRKFVYSKQPSQYLKKIINTGKPRLVSVGDQPAIWQIPLFFEHLHSDFIHLHAKTLKVVEWPAYILSGGRFPLFEEQWLKLRTTRVNLLKDYFILPPAETEVEFGLYEVIEDYGVRRILGMPIYLEKLTELASNNPEDNQLKDNQLELFIIEHGLNLPAKNMEESFQRINQVNLNQQPQPVWKFVSGYRQSAIKCLPFAGSQIIDWFSVMDKPKDVVLNEHFDRYQNFLNDHIESGFNPRILEAIYHFNHSRDQQLFSYTQFINDHITGEPIADNLKGLGQILSQGYSGTVTDPTFPDRRYPVKFNSQGNLKTVFNENNADSGKMISALHNHGILLGGIAYRLHGVPLYQSVHAVAIIGYLKINAAVYFIYQENYGDFGPDYREADGGPLYRIMPAGMFNEVYCWVNPLNIEIDYSLTTRKFTVALTDNQGHPRNFTEYTASFGSENNPVELELEKTGYYSYRHSGDYLAIPGVHWLTIEGRSDYFMPDSASDYRIRSSFTVR